MNHLHVVLDRAVHNGIDNAPAVLDVPLIEWNGAAGMSAKAWILDCTLQGDRQPGSMGFKSNGGMFCLGGMLLMPPFLFLWCAQSCCNPQPPHQEPLLDL